MIESHPPGSSPASRSIRWWPAVLITVVAIAVVLVLRANDQVPFQRRNLQSLGVAAGTFGLLFLWWITVSRARWRLRLGVAFAVLGLIGLAAATFRIRGVSGDLLPILEPRWVRSVATPAVAGTNGGSGVVPSPAAPDRPDFPQFLGPDRTAVLSGPLLETNWSVHPPQIIWRTPVGAGWSGFAIVGDRALTQEQRGEDELITCRDALTGALQWTHADPAHYATTIAGEGPRCTPTVVSNRVYTLGATGILNCLDLVSGQRHWTRSITADASTGMPEWGFSGSPLVIGDLVVVSAGGQPDKSLLAYRVADGSIAWTAGSAPVNYGSPFLTTLAGRRQILAFNGRRITAHDAVAGTVLWEHPWGLGQPHVAAPVVVGSNRVVFSSGYGVGAELLEIAPGPDGGLAATRVWQSKRMKAKFSNPVARDGFLYGLDDGILACVDLKDGSQRWKEGRYGHGQGLLIGDRYLLMSEKGELVLLQPTPEGPNERQRAGVLSSKTWNPIALSGDLLLVRNDREAAGLRLSIEASIESARKGD
ncbi:MAG: PQQ-binding-like beta-propeller repeat protein [Limisphaerales bacterium]